MFCYNCGSQLDEKAVICPHCGVQVRALSRDPSATTTPTESPNITITDSHGEPIPQPRQVVQVHPQPTAQQQPQPQQAAQPQGENALAIVGFILSFFVPLAGLICSILGLKKANLGAPNKGLAVAGVVISSITLGICTLYALIFGSYMCTLCSICLSTPIY